MERFESILFLYKNSDRLIYQLYAEFLRLMGIYVCEDVLCEQGNENRDWNASDFSVRYIINESDELDGIKCTIEERLAVLKKWLGSFVQDQSFFEAYDIVCPIFDKYKLLQASTVLQYFKKKEQEILDEGDRFEWAADDLTELLKKEGRLGKNRYLRYANLYCKQKANSSRYIYGKSLIYYVDKLAEQGLRLIEDFEGFSNAWVLLGLVCEKSRDLYRETVDAYQKAIRAVADKPYAANIHYWLGKCYEGQERYICHAARREYEMAYRAMKKYRNAYKMAIPYKDENKWQTANQYFLECIRFLDVKKGYLDPLEQEYYFKVNVMISFCCLKLGKYFDTIRYAQAAQSLKRALENGLEEDNDETKFYRKLYKTQAKRYIQLAIDRMGELQIYRYLSLAYYYLQMPQEADEALRKAEYLERN